MRTFVAIDLPQDLSAALTAADPGREGLRWTEPARLHLTLAFLGEVDPPAVGHVVSGLEEIRATPFELGVRGIGVFGGIRGRALVVWAGVTDPDGALQRLRDQVVNAVAAAGVRRRSGRFHPHFTLGRSRRLTSGDLGPWLAEHRDRDFGSLPVREFGLYSSVLRPEGAEHRIRVRFRLAVPDGVEGRDSDRPGASP